MDKRVELWIKVMTISKKIWGCHQRPERSFFFLGYQFPLCARCTGVLIGYLLSFMLLKLGCFVHISICLLSFLPLVLDGGIQLLCNILSNNTRRFLTGIIFGIGFIQVIANILGRFYITTEILVVAEIAILAAVGGAGIAVGTVLLLRRKK